MNYIIFLLLLFLIITFLFQISNRDSVNKFIQIVIVLSIFFLFSLEIKMSADWDAYVLLFENKEAKVDPIFRYLSTIFKGFGYKFEQLYQFHIIIISLIFINFVRKVNNNIFFVFGAYIILYFVPITNQIRYYLAFALFLNACYYLYVDKKIKLSIILFILSILSHSAISLLFLFLILNKASKKIGYVKLLMISSISLFVFSFFLQTIGIVDMLNKYGTYFSNEGTGSLLGGLFNIFPYITLLIVLYNNNKSIIKRKPYLIKDSIYILLYRLSMYSIVFIPISLYFQILSHRYVLPFTVVWLCLYLYPYQKSKNQVKVLQQMWLVFFVFFVLFFYNYFLSEFIFGEKSLYLIQFEQEFNSIPYFK